MVSFRGLPKQSAIPQAGWHFKKWKMYRFTVLETEERSSSVSRATPHSETLKEGVLLCSSTCCPLAVSGVLGVEAQHFNLGLYCDTVVSLCAYVQISLVPQEHELLVGVLISFIHFCKGLNKIIASMAGLELYLLGSQNFKTRQLQG